jgi:uncharacterized protein
MTLTWKSALSTLIPAIVASTVLFAQDYPKATGYVNDYAQLLSHDEGSSLNQELVAFENKTTIEIAVVIVSSLNGEDIENYTRGLATAWGVGKRGQNNGVVFLIAPKERTMRIETASGARAILTDARANEIRDETILPRFKSGDMPRGIIDGAHAIIRVFDPTFKSANPKESTAGDTKLILEYAIGAIAMVGITLLLIVPRVRRNKARAYVLDKKERLAARFAETENTMGHSDVTTATRDKFSSLSNDFSSIKQLTPSSKATNWFAARDSVDSLDRSLQEITSTMKEEIVFASNARRDSPGLMKTLPRMIQDAEKRLAKGNQSPEAEKYLEHARIQFAQAQGRYSGGDLVDWVLLYTILHNVQSNVTHAESSHDYANPSHSSVSPVESNSSYGFGDNSGGFSGGSGFGGGGGFDSGGGGSSGSW